MLPIVYSYSPHIGGSNPCAFGALAAGHPVPVVYVDERHREPRGHGNPYADGDDGRESDRDAPPLVTKFVHWSISSRRLF